MTLYIYGNSLYHNWALKEGSTGSGTFPGEWGVWGASQLRRCESASVPGQLAGGPRGGPAHPRGQLARKEGWDWREGWRERERVQLATCFSRLTPWQSGRWTGREVRITQDRRTGLGEVVDAGRD